MSKKSKKPKLYVSRELAKHAFGEVITRAARLASFGASDKLVVESDISEKQNLLALDDLLIFSIQARRLIDSAEMSKTARSVMVPLWSCVLEQDLYRYFESNRTINFWKFLNAVIHSADIQLVRTQFQTALMLKRPEEDVVETFVKYHRKGSFRPKCFVITDRREVFVLDLAQVVEIFDQLVLVKVLDYWHEKRLFLGVDYESD